MAGITQRKAVFSEWSPSKENNKKPLVLLMEENGNIDINNNNDRDKNDISGNVISSKIKIK